MKKILVTISILFIAFIANTQTIFLTQGRVEYEKKINQYKALESDNDERNAWVAEYKKTLQQFVTDIYELHFTGTKSVYKLKQENTDNKYLWGSKPSETDVVLQDIENNKLSIQRDVFEETYLIKDSIRMFDWKITGETREIAGFECKKAVTKICDSVYIVAFFTDQIIANTGPESFNGLPGLILGLAVPRLATTWFATKVETTMATAKELSPIQKGKKVNWKRFYLDMNKAMKDWGKEGASNTWKFSL
jgi:GLPGLI family protein